MLRVKQSNHQQLIKLRPDPKVHGLKYSHPCYDLVYVPRDAIIDCAIPGKGLSEDNAAAQSSRPNSNDEIVDAPRSEPNPTEESTEVPTSRTIANESNIIEATSRANSSDAELATPLEEEGIHLSKDRGITKSLVAFFQLCFSTFTLVKSRANQIDVYGYAAFSLTVAPYAVMAAVNLLANIVQPTYPSLFLVRNDVMAEIEDAFAVHFDNTVGTVRQIEDPTQEERGVVPPYLNRFLLNHEMGELDQHHRVYGIPSTPPNAALQLMTPDQAVAQGVLPLGVISVDPCQRLETRRGSPNVRRGIM